MDAHKVVLPFLGPWPQGVSPSRAVRRQVRNAAARVFAAYGRAVEAESLSFDDALRVCRVERERQLKVHAAFVEARAVVHALFREVR